MSSTTYLASATHSAASTNSPQNAAPGPQSAARIVLVDDDDFFRESLSLNLLDEGFAVTTFSNGPDALGYFENGGETDVVLLDWRMPQMNGLELLAAVVRHHPEIPVVLLTAHGTVGSAVEALKQGF